MSAALPTGYTVRRLRESDAVSLAATVVRNREHLAPTSPVRDETYYTLAGQRRWVGDRLALEEKRSGFSWVIEEETVGVVASINLNHVVWGPLRSAVLGYWVDASHTGRGLATAGAEHACQGAAELGLHRIEAATMLDNVASQAVLRRCGFEFIGTARGYLHLAGAWRDHHLYQRIVGD